MNKLILFFSLCFCTNFIYAQVSEAIDKVEDSYDDYEAAFKKIKNAISSIEGCYNANSIDDIHYYASDAESYLSSAKRYIGYAYAEADDAEDEAKDIDCSDAEDKSSDAGWGFYKAKMRISDAIKELSDSQWQDEPKYISYNLSNASDYINQVIKHLESAVNDLNDTIEALEDCK